MNHSLPGSAVHGIPQARILAAAAAKLLQSCPTLCDPIDGSPPGSPVPGILQARILEWVAISFSRGSSWSWIPTCVSYISCNGSWEAPQPCVCVCVCVCVFSFRFFSIIGYYKIVEHTSLCCVVCLSRSCIIYLFSLLSRYTYCLPALNNRSQLKKFSHTQDLIWALQ